MLFRLADVESLAAMAHERGILLALDNSWATPLYQKPLLSGVDLVVHSATKYLAGHSDLLAGAVAGREDLLARVFEHGFMLLGGLLSPFDAWLLNRGLRTLPVRMRQHHAGGLAVARWLAGHPKVRRVFHPALASGAESVLAGRLTGFSGLLSCELAVDRYADLRTMVDRLRRFRIGVSWGGVESLVLAPNRGSNLEVLAAQGIPAGTIRLSVGLEPPEILIEDLEGALATL
jgi:cystathionine beta-lyase/cystathionine gamma-synthase